MAEFKTAFKRTLAYEGGYFFSADDPGGETYKGITRRYFPTWAGWPIADEARSEGPDFPDCLERNTRLPYLVWNFYLHNFWHRVAGDEIGNRWIAEEVFDTAVNMGCGTAIRFLQEALNFLNREERDLVVDGVIGPKTLKTLKYRTDAHEANYILAILFVLRGNRYLDLMRKSPSQEKFARGWLNRLTGETEAGRG